MKQRSPLLLSLAGAVTFAVVTVGDRYFADHQLSYSGLIGGIAWFVVSYPLLKGRARKNRK